MSKELNIPEGEYIAETFSVFQNTKTGDRLHLIFCANASINELIADTLNTYQRTKKLPSEMEAEISHLQVCFDDCAEDITDRVTKIKELEQEVERLKKTLKVCSEYLENNIVDMEPVFTNEYLKNRIKKHLNQ